MECSWDWLFQYHFISKGKKKKKKEKEKEREVGLVFYIVIHVGSGYVAINRHFMDTSWLMSFNIWSTNVLKVLIEVNESFFRLVLVVFLARAWLLFGSKVNDNISLTVVHLWSF